MIKKKKTILTAQSKTKKKKTNLNENRQRGVKHVLETFLYRSSGCNAIHLLAASAKVTFLDRSVGVLRWKSLSFALRPVAFGPGCLQNPEEPRLTVLIRQLC